MQRVGPPAPDASILHKSFRVPGVHPGYINEFNVLDFFCNPANPFYDTKSCNQQLKMQNIDRPMNECMQLMVGDQYVVHDVKPPLFTICKQYRSDANTVTPKAYYYLINGVVYQCPDAYSLLQSRVLSATDKVRQAFKLVTEYSKFNVASGYSWDFRPKDKQTVPLEEKEDSDDEDLKIKKRTGMEVRPTRFHRERMPGIMQALYEQFPPPMGLDPLPSDPPAPPPPPSIFFAAPEQPPQDAAAAEPAAKKTK